ncbi:aminoglycoside phosphotransferase family protein [Yoonia sp. BS5-3]|uniref:Aminoglycoside phosphotransferase family protein n=1 Tax=Yoonia phaeophyticola TaxID=3137369 RepID=A0ABZ2V382_9RHOB
MTPPLAVLRQHQLSKPVHIAETAIAHVWRVNRSNGDLAALKIYKNGDTKGEETGFRLTSALNGHGAARVHFYADAVAILEWLDGPSLDTLSHNGNDLQAAATLIKVADQIHANAPPITLPSLAENFAALIQLKLDPSWPAQTQRNISFGRKTARALLDNSQDMRALHGDLHHQNIKDSARGYLAYDAKGLIGDRAYELAAAFQNPLGADALVTDPARARQLAQIWAQHWGTSPNRILSWAAAHSALSMTWAGNFEQPLHMRILDMLCAVAGLTD